MIIDFEQVWRILMTKCLMTSPSAFPRCGDRERTTCHITKGDTKSGYVLKIYASISYCVKACWHLTNSYNSNCYITLGGTCILIIYTIISMSATSRAWGPVVYQEMRQIFIGGAVSYRVVTISEWVFIPSVQCKHKLSYWIVCIYSHPLGAIRVPLDPGQFFLSYDFVKKSNL